MINRFNQHTTIATFNNTTSTVFLFSPLRMEINLIANEVLQSMPIKEVYSEDARMA